MESGYKPAHCTKIKVRGKVYFLLKKDARPQKNKTKKRKIYGRPLEFIYTANDEVILKQVIEQQMADILLSKLPENCVKIKIKFIIYFYFPSAE